MLKINQLKRMIAKQNNQIGAAYAPAHLTGIFKIYHHINDPLRSGSKGVGICIDRGMETYVIPTRTNLQKITVYFNDKIISGNTTKSALNFLIGDDNYSVEVYNYSQLPLSQGFGLSGAGALTSVLALNKALELGIEYKTLVNFAHKAEIENGTGLGDVIAQTIGGMVIREREGGYGFGKVMKIHRKQIDYETTVAVAVFPGEIKTSDIIKNTNQINRINSAAEENLIYFMANPSFKSFFKNSYDFAQKTGLMNENIRKILQNITERRLGLGSMVMLGNTIFAIGDVEKIIKMCPKKSNTLICKLGDVKARAIA
jgi:pantoate kinase